MAPARTDSIPVDGPDGQKVRVLFYDDGSIRFRVQGAPWVLEEAFLSGTRNDHAIIKIAPKR